MKKLMISSAIGLLLATNLVNAECNLEQGKRVYNKCAACHSLQSGVHMMGPSLHGLVERKAGAAEGFLYSVAMEQSGMAYIAGTSMPFGGLKNDKDREAVICYLQSVK